MALDQDQKPSASISAPTSGIDNEIAAYRAISPAAILSLLCGVVAVLSFTSWFFLVFTIAAIALGLSAERRIRRDPEIWTGRKMAQAGIALGLIFGLAAVTSTLVQDFLRSRAAGQFASQYADILRKGKIEDAAYYTVSPLAREGKKPGEVFKELTAQAQPGMPNEQLTTLQGIHDRLTSGPGESIAFERIEAHGLEGMNAYASVLYLLKGPGTQKYPEKEQFALIFMKGATIKGKTQWWIENSKFPYEPASYVHKEKAGESGHGHAH
ncbi:DUF4190 domain-containing protein [Singulisphaera sp. Ch08]|uniref:DUF4190 domain-containing protein n=1 Tax=Singulisphaera sp. Ch08 TaxID=3120278 RepID=A0AAU7CRB8_9BACT